LINDQQWQRQEQMYMQFNQTVQNDGVYYGTCLKTFASKFYCNCSSIRWVSPSQCCTTVSQIGLNIGVWNADGLANKAFELELFVKCHNIDIMLVSETHFCSRSYYKLHEYDIHQATHPIFNVTSSIVYKVQKFNVSPSK